MLTIYSYLENNLFRKKTLESVLWRGIICIKNVVDCYEVDNKLST